MKPFLRVGIVWRYKVELSNGNGIQSIYLTEISEDFAHVLSGLIGEETRRIFQTAQSGQVLADRNVATNDDIDLWERKLEDQIKTNVAIADTEREAIIRARRGQGLFKQRVMDIETHCRITGVGNITHLLASHCKPWRDSSNGERLNGENGLLLTPSIDHLFDRGFIGFEDSGELIISPVAHRPSLKKMGIEIDHVFNVGAFTEGQRQFLDYHRQAVLLRIDR